VGQWYSVCLEPKKAREQISARISRFDSGRRRVIFLLSNFAKFQKRKVFIDKLRHRLKKMRGKFILFLVLVMFLMSYASAVTTDINVKTLKNVKVSVFILDPAQVYYLLNSSHVQSGEAGEVLVSYSGEEKEVNVRVQITEEGKQIMLEKFEGVKTGKPVNIRMFVGDVSLSQDGEKNETVAVANQTSANLTSSLNSIVSNETQNLGISGSVIAEGGNFFAKWWYYLAGGVILVIVIGFLAFRFFMNKDSGQQLIHSDKRPITSGVSVSSRKLEELLGISQRKIIELQKEVGTLKNKEKIQAAERKIEEDKKELERLRRGGN